jgi:flagellar assembly protein FliH
MSDTTPQEFTVWSPAELEESATSVAAASNDNQAVQHSRMLTASQIENLQKEAWDEAYALGLEEGRRTGLEQVKEKARLTDEALNGLDRSFASLDDIVVDELVSLCITMVKQLIRREIKIDPGQIVAVVREALNTIPLASRGIQVHLHPDDAHLIRETLAAPDQDRTWKIVEEPMMSRGGCKISTEQSMIDASVETRVAHLIANVFGDERDSDDE